MLFARHPSTGNGQHADPADQPALAVTALHKAFRTQPVLRGVDLTVPKGSVTAILGPSGSGKTTFLRVVAGFERADSGQVELCGRRVDGRGRWVPPEERGIGYVPQEGGLFPHLTVSANIAFGLPRSRRHSQAVSAHIELVGLSGLERRYPHELSGGQQQRVALARALVIEPALVLLDEPFSSLDVALRAAVREDVRRVLRDLGTTAVIVTHDQDEALSMADQVALIRDGRISQVGPPQELYSHPSDPDVAAFLGDANLVSGRLCPGGRAVETPLGRLDLRRVPDATEAAGGGGLTVLIRPEQVELAPVDGSRGGLPGRVVRAEFYGHDCVVTLEPTPGIDGLEAVTARSQGGTTPEVGSMVTAVASGTAVAWPAGGRS